MGYALRAGLSFCCVGEMPIFLDLAKDRYFCLDGDVARAFCDIVDANDRNVVASVIDRYPVLGSLLVASGRESNIAPCRIDKAQRQVILDPNIPQPALWLMVRSTVSLLRAGMTLKSRTLHATVAELAVRKRLGQKSAVRTERDVYSVAAAFAKIRAFTTTNDTCLRRSIAMASLCHSYRIPVEIVFGVSARPFSAHCWVQYRDEVLNDTLDNVRRYQPILAI